MQKREDERAGTEKKAKALRKTGWFSKKKGEMVEKKGGMEKK